MSTARIAYLRPLRDNDDDDDIVGRHQATTLRLRAQGDVGRLTVKLLISVLDRRR